jgi:predicted RNA-binding Zn ribbon-like protein
MESESDRWLNCETGGVWLDLVATVRRAYGPEPFDRLESPRLLGSWLAGEGLKPRLEPGDDDLVRARELREAMRGLGLATVRAAPWSEADVMVVNRALADDRPLVLSPEGLQPPATTREALARIAREAVGLLAGPAAAELGRCSDSDCGMLFVDPGGRRRWCSATTCGVRHRVRAFRERQSK